MNKIIFLDWGIFLHRAIFSWRKNKKIPATWGALNMIIACLKRIGIDPDDIVIVAVDSPHSWRKDIEKEYKANRKVFRDSFKDIDWGYMYNNFDKLLENLDISTNWHIIKTERMEADDIIAVGCKHFKESEIIIVSFDSDFEQLVIYSNVKIFSPITKKYKIIKNPYKILAKKIEKETTDNLINPILSKEDYEKRKICVDLVDLPEFVIESIKPKLEKIDNNKDLNIELLPFKSIQNKFMDIYNNDKIVSYEECINKSDKKRRRKTKCK